MELAKTDLTMLPESERNILTLTGARLLMATAEPHVYEAVTAVFSCADHDFTARGRTVIAAGWKDIDRRFRATLKKKPDSDDEENELALDVRLCGRHKQPRPGKGKDISFTFRQHGKVSFCKLHSGNDCMVV